MVKRFNKYAKENDLEVEIELNLYNGNNSTLLVNDYGTTIEYLLQKGSTKYDIIFHDIMYNRRYSSYLVDLSKYLSKEHINMYAEGVAKNACTYNGRWVGLVCHILSMYSMINIIIIMHYIYIYI